ncbi:MAG: MFS transporter [Candidatus Aenigmarchaeota archaeon]|nr:MFS transporter [Candidatus Aenigmarchaeota archaeon]
MQKIRNILFIQGIYAFVDGILIIVIPLLMIERKINIVTMGLIFASLPITFQLLRFFFATLSDHYGRKKFVILHGITTAFSSTIFYFAYTPLQFLAGKLTQSIKDASIWGINRPMVLDHAENKKRGLIFLRMFDYIFGALGILIAGFLIAYFFFPNTILFAILMGLFVFPFAFFLKDQKTSGGSLKKLTSSLNFMKKEPVFKKVMIFWFIMGLSDGFATAYIFPLFLSQNSFSPELIGVLLGLQSLIAGFSVFLFRKLKITTAMALALSYAALLFMIPNFTGTILSIMIILIGVTGGFITSSGEGIMSRITSSKSYGTDIGTLLLGYHFARTINLSISGWLIASYGFVTLFSLSAIFFVVGTFYGLRNIRE